MSFMYEMDKDARRAELGLPGDVYIVQPIDEEFGVGLPLGSLRTATALENELGTDDTSVITDLDIVFGTAGSIIQRHRDQQGTDTVPPAES